MKLSRHFYKLLRTGLFLILLSGMIWNIGGIYFYNPWLELALNRPLLPILTLVWMWFVWQITNGTGIIKIVRWVIEFLLAVFAIAGAGDVVCNSIAVIQGDEKDPPPYIYAPYIEVVSQEPGPAGTIIQRENQYSRVPLVSDSVHYDVILQKPVVKDILYAIDELWYGDNPPSETELQTISKELKRAH